MVMLFFVNFLDILLNLKKEWLSNTKKGKKFHYSIALIKNFLVANV